MSVTERISSFTTSASSFIMQAIDDRFRLKKSSVFKDEGRTLNQWKMEMLLHFYCFPLLFSSEEKKILFALSYTSDPASA